MSKALTQPDNSYLRKRYPHLFLGSRMYGRWHPRIIGNQKKAKENVHLTTKR